MNELNNVSRFILYLILFLVGYQLIIFIYLSIKFLYRHFLCKEIDLVKRYGKNSYVIITGASSGQGRFFAIEFAKRNFNLILIGSSRTQNTINEIKQYSNVKIRHILKDFREAYKTDFFADIKKSIADINGNICGLVNNVAYRSAWNPYHKTPEHLINDTIIVGTIVQSQLSRICIPFFLNRKQRSFIINITAQCIFPTFGLGEILDNNITVPFLSVYEATNAFGFYQGNSLFKEYNTPKYKIDIMNVMPGAVVTENTSYLSNTIFNVNADNFVKNIIKQLGIFNGNTYGYWGHEFSIVLVNLFPFIRDRILYNVGYNISKEYMNTPQKGYTIKKS